MDEVNEVREGIRGYFENHFKKRVVGDFELTNLGGSKIVETVRGELERAFDEKEIKKCYMGLWSR